MPIAPAPSTVSSRYGPSVSPASSSGIRAEDIRRSVLEVAMPPVPRIGTEFAGYRIEAMLGRGGMSVVYRAQHARLGSAVALKLLSDDLAEDEAFRERFVREARLAAGLNHPNVIPILDAGDHDGVLYLAMRYVEGPDLKDVIRRDGPLGLDRTL